nr:hypothetical protein BaRGS_009749 [Batillaria attramentaria]
MVREHHGETIQDIRYNFRSGEREQELIGTYSADHFFAMPAFSQRVQYVDNGSLVLNHVTLGDSGKYTIEIVVRRAGSSFSDNIRTAYADVTAQLAGGATLVVDETKARLTLLEAENTDLKALVKSLGNSAETLQNATGSLHNTTQTLESKTKVLQVKADTLESKVNSLFPLGGANRPSATFHARLQSSQHVSVPHHVILGRVLLNEGDAYNGTSGVFTAPYNGTYFLIATTADGSRSPNNTADFAMMVDDNEFEWSYTLDNTEMEVNKNWTAVSLFFQTPYGRKSSSKYQDGRFYLQLPNPVEGGEYSCILPSTDPATSCLPDGSLLEAAIVVDEIQVRLTLLEAENKALKAENTDMKAAVKDIKAENTDMKAAVKDIKAENTDMKAAVKDIKAENTDMKAAVKDIKAENTDMKAAVKDIKAENTDMKAAVKDIKAENTDIKAAVKDIKAENTDIKAAVKDIKAENTDMKAAVKDIKAENTDMTAAVKDIKAENTDMKAAVKDIKAENTNMKAAVKDIKAENKNLKAENTDMKAAVKDIKAENTGMKTAVKALKAENTDMKAAVKDIKAENTDMKAAVKDLKAENTDMKAAVKDIKMLVNNNTATLETATRRVAFHAQLSRSQRAKSLNPVILDRVMLNEGGAYSGTTGRFTVPYTGTYFLIASTADVSSASSDNGETIEDIRYNFRSEGREQELIGMYSAGHFLAMPAFSQRVQYAENAALLVDETKARLTLLEAENTDLKTLVKSLGNRAEALAKENDVLKNQTDSFEHLMKQKTDSLQQKLDDATATLVTVTRRVAFHARPSDYLTVAGDSHVTLGRVFLNEGGAYSGTTGNFTVPYDGTYFLIATSADANRETIEDIRYNFRSDGREQELIGMYSAGHFLAMPAFSQRVQYAENAALLVDETKARLTLLEAENTDLKTLVKSLGNRAEALAKENDVLKNQTDSFEHLMKQKTDSLQQKLDDATATLVTVTRRVAFHARPSDYLTVARDSHVTLDKVFLNEGGAYSGTTGNFTVPYNGTYFLIATSADANNNSEQVPEDVGADVPRVGFCFLPDRNASWKFERGHFFLMLQNPVKGGKYSCVLPRNAHAKSCLPPESPGKAALVVDENKARLTLLEAENTDMKAALETATRRVAFHARLSGGRRVSSGHPVILDTVLLNEGGAYNGTTGSFTVPYTGTYFLIATTADASSSSSDYGNMRMMADNQWARVMKLRVVRKSVVRNGEAFNDLGERLDIEREHHRPEDRPLGDAEL